jgi:hypothetical protein
MLARSKGQISPERYADRGIAVCDRWKTFENFLADMGEAPPSMSLDRYPDFNGNYEPSNCRWATAQQQGRNTSKTIFLEIDGVRTALPDFADALGVQQDWLRRKFHEGRTPDAMRLLAKQRREQLKNQPQPERCTT